ncbi:recombination mediator RecR [Cyclobacteriaceae bacterium]|nr:recombination mediator RecR [Cyclobacteriaceae bacterium]
MNFPSKLVEEAVEEIAKLPGIGKKTALRLAMHLLKKQPQDTASLTKALTELRTNVKYCKQCHSISDDHLCNVCTSINREQYTICLVEETKDVLVIENTNQYFGLYHVLGGIINPMEGIGPSELNIESLIERLKNNPETQEVILALSSTMEGDTTAFYISKKLKELGIKVSSIARGIPIGGEIEYADELTLGRSILNRINY